MDEAVRKGHAQGYVTTLMNRRRYLPELTSANYAVRSFGERCAMNSPIQGTAADIIKLAMIAVDRELRAGGFEAKLILQVHDELIVEAPEAEAEAVRDLLRCWMRFAQKRWIKVLSGTALNPGIFSLKSSQARSRPLPMKPARALTLFTKKAPRRRPAGFMKCAERPTISRSIA